LNATRGLQRLLQEQQHVRSLCLRRSLTFPLHSRLSLTIVCHSTALSSDLPPALFVIPLPFTLFLSVSHSCLPFFIYGTRFGATNFTWHIKACVVAVVVVDDVVAVVGADYSHRLAFVKFHELALFTTWVVLTFAFLR